jgi:hypothetical protein
MKNRISNSYPAGFGYPIPPEFGFTPFITPPFMTEIDTIEYLWLSNSSSYIRENGQPFFKLTLPNSSS